MHLNIIIFIATTFLALSVGHIQTIKGPSYVRLELFRKGNCNGRRHIADLDYTCYYFPSLENDISGVFMPIGSCAKIFNSSRDCVGESLTIRFPDFDFCELPCCGWNNNIKSVMDCDTHLSTILCPRGSYVREIFSGEPNQGITVSCYEPTRTVPSYTRNTHGIAIQRPRKSKCPIAAFGISASWNQDWLMWENPSLSCKRSKSNNKEMTLSQIPRVMKRPSRGVNGSLSDARTRRSGSGPKEAVHANCDGKHEALIGLEAVIDEADVIKELLYFCSEVPNPSEMCEPTENLTTVTSCDNRESPNELECSYNRTVGVGLASAMTDTERKEHQWSLEAGFEISTSIDSLGESMSTKLGYSELVAYEWSLSDTTTWREELTVSATINVKPHMWTVVQQLTGKCTFYGVRVNYFKTIDMDRNGNIISVKNVMF